MGLRQLEMLRKVYETPGIERARLIKLVQLPGHNNGYRMLRMLVAHRFVELRDGRAYPLPSAPPARILRT